MKTNKNKIDVILYKIYSDVFPDEESREQAINQSKIAFSIVKQDALFRTMTELNDEP